MRKQVVIGALGALVVAGSASAATNVNEPFNTFGAFAGFQETSSTGGFGFNVWDGAGRTLSNHFVTTDMVAPGNLATITSRLFINTDADLFKFQITNPATFSAYITGTTPVLALFDSNGVAIAASRGGGIGNAITGPLLPVGQYYIGIAATDTRTQGANTPSQAPYVTPLIGQPYNAAGQALFDFSSDGVKAPVNGLGDYTLATDPRVAWGIYGDNDQILSTATFTVPGTVINLTGADFSVVPEPASIASLGLLALGMISRRRAR